MFFKYGKSEIKKKKNSWKKQEGLRELERETGPERGSDGEGEKRGEEERTWGKVVGEKTGGYKKKGDRIRRGEEEDWGRESLQCPRINKAQWLSHTGFFIPTSSIAL